MQLHWVPSHLDVHGNEQADLLAEMGRNLHPNNLMPLSKRQRVTKWDALGLEPMEDPVHVQATLGVGSVNFWSSTTAWIKGGGHIHPQDSVLEQLEMNRSRERVSMTRCVEVEMTSMRCMEERRDMMYLASHVDVWPRGIP